MVQQIDKQVLDSTLKCLDHVECWPQSAVLVKRLFEISVSHAKKSCWSALLRCTSITTTEDTAKTLISNLEGGKEFKHFSIMA
jgi:hypothetical protein